MEGENDERTNDVDDMRVGNISDDNLGSCGSVDDVKTPPEDDMESLNHSLSSPGAFSGLSYLQSPSTSLASPLRTNSILYNNSSSLSTNDTNNNNNSNNNSNNSHHNNTNSHNISSIINHLNNNRNGNDRENGSTADHTVDRRSLVATLMVKT